MTQFHGPNGVVTAHGALARAFANDPNYEPVPVPEIEPAKADAKAKEAAK